jgi:adenine/guanine phosphoribosyltransferase-like PRPP-binding protein
MPVSGYILKAFNPTTYKATLRAALKTLKEYEDTFDAIAIRGTSGLLFGPPLTMMLKKSLIVVRKPKAQESSHSSHEVETNLTKGTYLIVDDCIGGGSTIKAIGSGIKKVHPHLKSNGHVYLWGTNVYSHRDCLEEFM